MYTSRYSASEVGGGQVHASELIIIYYAERFEKSFIHARNIITIVDTIVRLYSWDHISGEGGGQTKKINPPRI